MSVFSDRLKELRGSESQSSFAAAIGLNRVQYAKYESSKNAPSIEVLANICRIHACSADWLLGLPDRGTSATTITGNSGSIAIGHGAKANCTRLAPDCTQCKYKVFAEAFKAIQTPS